MGFFMAKKSKFDESQTVALPPVEPEPSPGAPLEDRMLHHRPPVIPAQAGIQKPAVCPACADASAVIAAQTGIRKPPACLMRRGSYVLYRCRACGLRWEVN